MIIKFDGYDALDSIADQTERLLTQCGLPGQVRGGCLYPGLGIEMQLHWHCNSPALQVDACSQLRNAIRRAFGVAGGVDANRQTVWLLVEKGR